MMTLNKPYEIFWLMKNPFWSIPIVQTIFLYIKKLYENEKKNCDKSYGGRVGCTMYRPSTKEYSTS